MSSVFSALGRAHLKHKILQKYTADGEWSGKIPIVYRDEYNISFWGLEKLHPFDSCKFRKVVAILERAGVVQQSKIFRPLPISDEELLDVHTEEYLRKLRKDKFYICQILEFPLACILPTFILSQNLVRPCLYHTGGAVSAIALAVEHGWAINIGGGAHHARWNHGEGWCFFADITLGIHKIRRATDNEIQRVMYIDCDVHQGNGVEHDKLHFKDSDLYILDVYNAEIWPGDRKAKDAIDNAVTLTCRTGDNEYLQRLSEALAVAKLAFRPDLIVYNAGTDILKGDPLGDLHVTPQGVIKRDEMIFQYAVDVRAPIVLMLSGGYEKNTHVVIADSILNLVEKFHLLSSPDATSETKAS